MRWPFYLFHTLPVYASSLSTLQRSLVALTALHLKLAPPRQVLQLYRVTAADLRQARADWEQLQAGRAAEAQVFAGGRLL